MGQQHQTRMSDKCKSLWDWGSLENNWKGVSVNMTDTKQYRFTANWSNVDPSSRGCIYIDVECSQQPAESIRIHALHQDAFHENAFHRMAVQYLSWVALQVTLHHFEIVENVQVLYVLPGHQSLQQHSSDIPQGWSDLGNVTTLDDERANATADLVVKAPCTGLLWDLAWDTSFDCRGSSMFQTFVNLYKKMQNSRENVTNDKNTQSQPSLGCFISRRGTQQQMLANRKEFLDLMRQYFSQVEDVSITTRSTTARIVGAIEPCQVLLGVHGGGLCNTVFAQGHVIEILPTVNPSYYRNLNMLLGHDYEGLQGSFEAKGRYVTVDLDQAEAALKRAMARL